MAAIEREMVYQREEAEESVCVSPQLIVGSTAEVYKLLESRRWSLSIVDHIRHVSCQDKRYPVPAYGGMGEWENDKWRNGGMEKWGNGGMKGAAPLDGSKHLGVAENLAKVNVKHVARPLYHDVVVMAITDSQYVSSNTVSSTRTGEIVHSLEKDREREGGGINSYTYAVVCS